MSPVKTGVTYIKEKNMDKLLNQIEHLWTDHKKLVIGVVVVMIILAIS